MREGRNGGDLGPGGTIGAFGSHGQSEEQPPSELDTSNSLSSGAAPDNS